MHPAAYAAGSVTQSAAEAALAQPFDAKHILWRASKVSEGKGLAMACVDAFAVQDRLDAVLGVAGWQDDYEVDPAGVNVCKLQCRINKEWITKVGVGLVLTGYGNVDPKAGYGESLRVAALKFGVGRYLLSIPQQWLDYDEKTKLFKEEPKLPAFAAPASVEQAKPATSTAELYREATNHDKKAEPAKPVDPQVLLLLEQRVVHLDKLIKERSKAKTWRAALQVFHVWPPEKWDEPQCIEDVRKIAAFIPEHTVEAMISRLEGVRK